MKVLTNLHEARGTAQRSAADVITFRPPRVQDGSAVWELVAESTLDSNSPYSYLMMFEYFADTCLVAELDGQVVGFVTGFRPPEEPETLFIWQIGVAEAARGRGLARALLSDLLARQPGKVRYLKATVNPSNQASLGLFRSMAAQLDTRCREREIFEEGLFPGTTHEAEMLLQIGPFSASEASLKVS